MAWINGLWFPFGRPSCQYWLVKTVSGQHQFGTFIFRLASFLISLTGLWTGWCYSGFVWNKKMTSERHQCASVNQVIVQIYLTLSVRGPNYIGLTRSMSRLLMPWLLTSPGYQQPWYWLHRMCRSFSYLRKDYKYLCHINVKQWHKM